MTAEGLRPGGLRHTVEVTADADVLRAYIARHSPLKVSDYAPGDAVVRK